MRTFCFILLMSSSLVGAELAIDKTSLTKIGLQVWQNECRGTLDGLVTWNAGEEFPSLGIGHFIWYPTGATQTFQETFPLLISFFKEQEVEVPSWLVKSRGCPWKTREDFQKAKRGKKVRELRDLLSSNLDLQIRFIYQRFQLAEKELLPSLSKKEVENLEKLKKSPQGIYALIDYMHFKGTGLSPKERYRGEGWGLLQVLQEMGEIAEGDSGIDAFTTSAKKVLAKRVRNAPLQRNEDRWLKGWHARLETYSSIHF